MPKATIPGVFVTEASAAGLAIAGVSTSLCAFIGPTRRASTDRAVRIDSEAAYSATFGPIDGPADHMGIAVHGFFQNGGNSALICPVDTNGYTKWFARVPELLADAGILVLPGQSWSEHPAGNPALAAAVEYCESARHAMVLIDSPADLVLTDEHEVARLHLPASSFAVAYYPWLDAPNPTAGATDVIRIPPSPLLAGLWARTDSQRGVWKAPAGTETTLVEAGSAAHSVTSAQQEFLNEGGINAIREFSMHGLVAWGARTLAARTEPQWKYLSVRRLGIFLERSIETGTRWAVFEPNAEPLWQSLTASVDAFMMTLFRQGAFQGVTPDEAWFARCGRGTTMTQTDIDAGSVILEVGFAPLRPAEFLPFRIRHTMASA